ncbi:50S ribosomal protein L6 [Candidatus Woesearchaeota archaeon]|nr:50S ribosomal protein L6 [Candidatus Woesearchaeota archaeon]
MEQKSEKIELPENTSASYKDKTLRIKGPKGEPSKRISGPGISIRAQENSIILEYSIAKKKTKKLAGSIRAHINNLLKGASKGFTYKMKICSGHFPMTVSVSGNELTVKNFFGEKFPRKIKVSPQVKIKIEGQEITIESAEKEAASQCAASIEQLTKRTKFDRRIFMDGIFITSKDK